MCACYHSSMFKVMQGWQYHHVFFIGNGIQNFNLPFGWL
jgi:hypothetical protein